MILVGCKNKCGQSVSKGRVFCSRSCAASYNNARFPKRTAKKRSCKNCPELIRSDQQFCGVRCFHSHKEKRFVYLWLSGLKDGRVGMGVSEYVRSYLVSRCGGACERCSVSEWLGSPVLLQVDHKDGNYTNCCEKNLWMLCPNCHAQQPTSGSRNSGKGRKDRLVYRAKEIAAVKEAVKVLTTPSSSSGKTPPW